MFETTSLYQTRPGYRCEMRYKTSLGWILGQLGIYGESFFSDQVEDYIWVRHVLLLPDLINYWMRLLIFNVGLRVSLWPND